MKETSEFISRNSFAQLGGMWQLTIAFLKKWFTVSMRSVPENTAWRFNFKVQFKCSSSLDAPNFIPFLMYPAVSLTIVFIVIGQRYITTITYLET